MNFDELPNEALLREKQLLHPIGPVPISRSSWWAGVRSGRFPQPIRLGPRTTAWRVGDIRHLLKRGVS